MKHSPGSESRIFSCISVYDQKKEAEERAEVAERQEFKKWKKQNSPASENSSKSKGYNGGPKGRQQLGTLHSKY